MMRSCDVVAWADTEHGAVVCLDCAAPGEAEEADWAPVFAGSEWDSFPSCDRCREGIYDVGLTPDGIEYHKEWLVAAGGVFQPMEAEALVQDLAGLLDGLSSNGVRVEEVRRTLQDGRVRLFWVPEGLSCPDGEHERDSSGECLTCGDTEA